MREPGLRPNGGLDTQRRASLRDMRYRASTSISASELSSPWSRNLWKLQEIRRQSRYQCLEAPKMFEELEDGDEQKSSLCDRFTRNGESFD